MLVEGLIVIVLVLAAVIVWLLWTTLSFSAHASTSSERKEPAIRQRRLSAEVFIETYRGKKSKGRDKG